MQKEPTDVHGDNNCYTHNTSLDLGPKEIRVPLHNLLIHSKVISEA